MIEQNSNQKGAVTFNDLPSMVTRILDEVSETRKMVSDLLKKDKPQREDPHKPMTVSEAAKYLTIPLPTLYDKLLRVRYRRPNPASDMCCIVMNLTNGLRAIGRIVYRLRQKNRTKPFSILTVGNPIKGIGKPKLSSKNIQFSLQIGMTKSARTRKQAFQA